MYGSTQAATPAFCKRRITVSTSAFHAESEGSIPFTCSNPLRRVQARRGPRQAGDGHTRDKQRRPCAAGVLFLRKAVVQCLSVLYGCCALCPAFGAFARCLSPVLALATNMCPIRDGSKAGIPPGTSRCASDGEHVDLYSSGMLWRAHAAVFMPQSQSIETGNAGARLACGANTRTRPGGRVSNVDTKQ